VLDGVDFALGSVQDVFENALVADVPLIGDTLSQLGGMIAELRNGLLGDLRARLNEPGKTVEIMRTTLYQVFGERLGILRDANGDKLVTLSDISIDSRASPEMSPESSPAARAAAGTGHRSDTSHHNVTSLVTKLVTNNWGSNPLLA
jgi:hypothetical protein